MKVFTISIPMAQITPPLFVLLTLMELVRAFANENPESRFVPQEIFHIKRFRRVMVQ